MNSIAVYHVASLLIYGLYKTLRLIHVRIEGSHHTNVDYIFDASEKTDVLIRSFVQIYKELCVEDIVSLYIFSPGEDEKPELLSRYQLSGKKEVYLNEFLIESHYRRFYSEAVEHTETCLETEKEISSYAPPQQLSLIKDSFNGLTVDIDLNQSLTELIVASCRENALSTAYIYEENEINYRELNQYANYYAFKLIEKGVKKLDYLFICMENCLELPVAYLACMKIGAVFVPVDPAWPQKRLQLLVETCEPKVVFVNTDTTLKSELPNTVIIQCIEECKSDEILPMVNIGPDDLLYGFFTSGSTGLPKCTLNMHKGIINRFNYMTGLFNPQPVRDVFLQNSNHVFDSSLWQLLWPLLHGCKIVIPKKKNNFDVEFVVGIIEKYQVTMTDFVPSLFNILVDKLKIETGLSNRLKSLKSLLIGGEEANHRYISEFYSYCPDTDLYNTYGHTEASIGMVFHKFRKEKELKIIPLGTPINNTYVVIADQDMKLLPIGCVGEIFVTGLCVGAGYLKDKEKTERVFFDNPFMDIPGERMFRTGDYGYWGADGLLYYCGREDDQIKISGVRIDLEEIESQILMLEGVKEVKVLFDKNKHALTAFVKSDLANLNVQEYCKTNLPKYAVPQYVVVLSEFPLNNNGKLDKVRLIAMAGTGNVAQIPEGDCNVVKRIFRSYLNVSDIPTDADFFALGGSSLAALKLILDIEKELSVKISLEEVYEGFTVDRISQIISGKGENEKPINESFHIDKIKEDCLFITQNVDVSNTVVLDSVSEKNELILLTGATGFLGKQLLEDLLKTTGFSIVCIIRSGKGMNPAEKLAETLSSLSIEVSRYLHRISVLEGDLSKERLGLSWSDYNYLLNNTTKIIHNGAEVNFFKSYAQLRDTNVKSLQYLLALSTTNSLKPIFYISSISVYSRGLLENNPGIVPENISYEFNDLPEDGYSQTKWASEKVLQYYRAKGFPVFVYRFGEIGMNEKNGLYNTNSLFEMLLQAIIHLGIRPVSELRFDYLPLNEASDIVIAGIRNGKDSDACNAISAGYTLQALLSKSGYGENKIKEVILSQFVDRLGECVRNENCPAFINKLFYFFNSEGNIKNNGNLDQFFFANLDRIERRNQSQQVDYYINKPTLAI